MPRRNAGAGHIAINSYLNRLSACSPHSTRCADGQDGPAPRNRKRQGEVGQHRRLVMRALMLDIVRLTRSSERSRASL